MTPGVPEGQSLDPPGLGYYIASTYVVLTLIHLTSSLAHIP